MRSSRRVVRQSKKQPDKRYGRGVASRPGFMNKKFINYKLESGYAETSTKRHPVEPETVIVGEDEVRQARCVGAAIIDGSSAWLAFKTPGKKRYYFQYRPW